MNKFSVLSILLVVTLVFSGAEESFQRVLVRNFPAPESGAIVIRNPVGLVTVRAADRSDIEIRYRLYADDGDFNKSRNLVAKMAMSTKEKDDTLQVDIELPFEHIGKLKFPRLGSRFDIESRWNGRSVKTSSHKGTEVFAELEISVPKNTAIIYEGIVAGVEFIENSGSLGIAFECGEIVLSRTSGMQKISTGKAKIKTEDVSGSVEIATGSADIEGSVYSIDRLFITSASGNIEIEAANKIQELEIAVQSGNVELNTVEIGGGEISTVSGKVKLDIDSVLTGELSIATVSGNVKIVSEAAFAIERHITLSGAISHPGIEGGTRTMEIDNPDGSGILRIDTISGDIKVDF